MQGAVKICWKGATLCCLREKIEGRDSVRDPGFILERSIGRSKAIGRCGFMPHVHSQGVLIVKTSRNIEIRIVSRYSVQIFNFVNSLVLCYEVNLFCSQ